MQALINLLETAKSNAESSSALMTYTTLINHETYMPCKQILTSLYTTESRTIELTVCGLAKTFANVCNTAS